MGPWQRSGNFSKNSLPSPWKSTGAPETSIKRTARTCTRYNALLNPPSSQKLQASHSQWDELDGGNRRRVRDALAQDFNEVCAYCEQRCDPVASSGALNAETIDHFRPRTKFPDRWLDWHNLIYACYRCNQNKENKWPGYDDAMTNKMLSAMDLRYVVPSEYVNRNASGRCQTGP